MKYKDNKSAIFQLQTINTFGLMDFNGETFDLNRHKHESIRNYLKRVLKNNRLSE